MAAPQVSTWKNGFGFLEVPDPILMAIRQELRILLFPGTEVLYKPLDGATRLTEVENPSKEIGLLNNSGPRLVRLWMHVLRTPQVSEAAAAAAAAPKPAGDAAAGEPGPMEMHGTGGGAASTPADALIDEAAAATAVQASAGPSDQPPASVAAPADAAAAAASTPAPALAAATPAPAAAAPGLEPDRFIVIKLHPLGAKPHGHDQGHGHDHAAAAPPPLPRHATPSFGYSGGGRGGSSTGRGRGRGRTRGRGRGRGRGRSSSGTPASATFGNPLGGSVNPLSMLPGFNAVRGPGRRPTGRPSYLSNFDMPVKVTPLLGAYTTGPRSQLPSRLAPPVPAIIVDDTPSTSAAATPMMPGSARRTLMGRGDSESDLAGLDAAGIRPSPRIASPKSVVPPDFRCENCGVRDTPQVRRHSSFLFCCFCIVAAIASAISFLCGGAAAIASAI